MTNVIDDIYNMMNKQYKSDDNWNFIYKVENKINDIIFEVYNGNILVRCELIELYTIKILFIISKKKYEYIISNRNNNYGFSIHSVDNIDDMYKYQEISHNITIKNDKFYLYNIYKIMFQVIR